MTLSYGHNLFNVSFKALKALLRRFYGAFTSLLRLYYAGEDVTLSYGDKLSNAQLQLEYGFKVTGNMRGEEKKEEKKEIVSPFQQGERTGGANSLC
jgi:hypothetical protein